MIRVVRQSVGLSVCMSHAIIADTKRAIQLLNANRNVHVLFIICHEFATGPEVQCRHFRSKLECITLHQPPRATLLLFRPIGKNTSGLLP